MAIIRIIYSTALSEHSAVYVMQTRVSIECGPSPDGTTCCGNEVGMSVYHEDEEHSLHLNVGRRDSRALSFPAGRSRHKNLYTRSFA